MPARASTTSSATAASLRSRARLVDYRGAELIGIEQIDPAGVDQREAPAVPLRGNLLAVARDAPGASCTNGLACGS